MCGRVITAQEMMRSEQSIQTLSNTRACKQNGTKRGQLSTCLLATCKEYLEPDGRLYVTDW